MWPLSTGNQPKQYHKIVTQNTMFQETLRRINIKSKLNIAPPTIVCSKDHQAIVTKQCLAENITPHHIVLEPMGRNTAAVGAIIAEIIGKEEPDGIVLLLPADHHIGDPDKFWEYINHGLQAVKGGFLTTLGILPTRPDTGFGYIHQGKSIGHNIYEIKEFVEKPELNLAEAYLASGEYFWNAGIFLFSCWAMSNSFTEFAPDILQDVKYTLSVSNIEGNVIHLDAAAFEKCRNVSIDYAIMERSNNVAMVAPVDIQWNDIGSWGAIHDMSSELKNGNAELGDIISIDCKGSYLRSEGLAVAAIGLENMIVVATKTSILIAPLDRAQDVKKIVEQLRSSRRDDLL